MPLGEQSVPSFTNSFIDWKRIYTQFWQNENKKTWMKTQTVWVSAEALLIRDFRKEIFLQRCVWCFIQSSASFSYRSSTAVSSLVYGLLEPQTKISRRLRNIGTICQTVICMATCRTAVFSSQVLLCPVTSWRHTCRVNGGLLLTLGPRPCGKVSALGRDLGVPYTTLHGIELSTLYSFTDSWPTAYSIFQEYTFGFLVGSLQVVYSS